MNDPRPAPLTVAELPGSLSTALLALNNAHAEELSLLDPARLEHLVAMAFSASRIGVADALLLAFDQGAPYDSANFLWFRDRYPRFVYVDRVVVAPAVRGRGLARRLYEHVFEQAGAAGHHLVGCEINVLPPNPASDAFHAALGFNEIGRARPSGLKEVRYVKRLIATEGRGS